MTRARGALLVEEVGFALVDRNQINVDPITAQADAVSEAIRHMQIGQSFVVGALSGQTAVIRYPRIPDLSEDEVVQAVENEAGQNIPYDLSEVYLDYYPLETVTEGEDRMLRILLVAAKHAVIDSRMQVADAADIEYSALTVDSLALADAAESSDFLRVGESVALVDIGLSSSSIHFTKDGVSNFIRDVSWGAREFIQAIAKVQRCEYEEAEQMLHDLGDAQEPPPVDESEMPTFDEDSVPDIVEQPTETDLGALETPELSAFDSPLDPLEDEFSELDTAAAQPALGGGLGGEPTEQDVREALNRSLNRLVSEIRRSFDYYEHQLYERPVDRLILCGGVAHMALVRDSLIEELGVDSVEVANPTNSALHMSNNDSIDLMHEHPATYMVAVGLAARGMAEL